MVVGKTERDPEGVLGAPGEQSGKKEFGHHESRTSGNRKRIWVGKRLMLSR
jgi:hypothetical protein